MGRESTKGENKIVVAVDESEESMYALSWCLGNLLAQSIANPDAAPKNTTIVLLYVKPPAPIFAASYLFTNDVVGAMEKYKTDLVRSVMERAEVVYRSFNTNNMNIEKKIGSGDAKDVICHTVDKLKADTLVMGSHGYGFFKRTLLGSVSDHCAKHAKCPVVIVKQPNQNRA